MSSIKHETWTLDFKPLEGWEESPSFTKIQVLPTGDVALGAAFGHPFLSVLRAKNTDQANIESLNLENVLESDALGIVGGFHSSKKGDVDISVMHSSKPGAIKKLFSGDFSNLKGAELVQKLDEKGEGSSVSSTHLQYKDGKFDVRRVCDPGLTWDLRFLGDYVFGVTPAGMWRERYLHLQIEKRESLRRDLLGNFQIHRDGFGSFWALMQNGRLSRFEYTESKAKPTTKKLPGLEKNHGFERSVASETDKWLYGVSGAGSELFRVRRNPESFEEEIQPIYTSSSPITALTAVDGGKKQGVVFSTESADGAKLYFLETVEPEDVEALPEVPKVEELGILGVPRIGALAWDVTQEKSTVLWAAEGYFGSEMTHTQKQLKVFKISV